MGIEELSLVTVVVRCPKRLSCICDWRYYFWNKIFV